MGIHYDGLKSVIKSKTLQKSIHPSVKSEIQPYLEDLISKTYHVHIPLSSDELRKKQGVTINEQRKQIIDYIALSRKDNEVLITPIDPLAVEDTEAVAILDKLKGEDGRITSSFSVYADNVLSQFLVIGDFKIFETSKVLNFPMKIKSVYHGCIVGKTLKEKEPSNLQSQIVSAQYLVRATTNYFEQVKYMMDNNLFVK